MNLPLSGYKTLIGAAIMGISAIAKQLGYVEAAEAFEKFAWAILALGLGHKIEKGASNKPPAGFSRFWPMFVMLIASASVLAGCAYFDRIYTKPKKPVCDDPAAYVVEHTIYASTICDVCRNKLNMEPEQLDGILLDTVAVSVITEVTDKIQVIRLIERLEGILAHENVQFAGLIAFLNLEAEQSQLVAAILARRLQAFSVPDVIGKFDRGLILQHLKNQKAQMGVFE